MATSAYGMQRRRVGGRWVCPLIDPRLGMPVMSTRTVSVIAPTCMVADALTKVVALRGSTSRRTLAAFGASAAILSPARGRWRTTLLDRPRLADPSGGIDRDAMTPEASGVEH